MLAEMARDQPRGGVVAAARIGRDHHADVGAGIEFGRGLGAARPVQSQRGSHRKGIRGARAADGAAF